MSEKLLELTATGGIIEVNDARDRVYRGLHAKGYTTKTFLEQSRRGDGSMFIVSIWQRAESQDLLVVEDLGTFRVFRQLPISNFVEIAEEVKKEDTSEQDKPPTE